MFPLSKTVSNGMTKSTIYQLSTNVFLKYNSRKPPSKRDLNNIYERVEELSGKGAEISRSAVVNVAEEYFRSINR